MGHDARLSVDEQVVDLSSSQIDPFRVPLHIHHRERAGSRRRAHFGSDPGNFGNCVADFREPGFPLSILSLQVARLNPRFYCGQHTHHFLLADFHHPAEGVVGRAVQPGGRDQFLSTHQEPGALGPADNLAAAIRYQIGAAGKIRIGFHGELGRGVHQHRYTPFAGGFHHLFQADLSFCFAGSKYGYHRRPAPERGVKLAR